MSDVSSEKVLEIIESNSGRPTDKLNAIRELCLGGRKPETFPKPVDVEPVEEGARLPNPGMARTSG
jgi:hypothetical protein